jgi:type II secretory pathway pseudopilin PulG
MTEPAPTAPPPPKPTRNVALIAAIAALGCLGLFFVLGIVAAIVIPNFLSAKVRAQQFGTMQDMRAIGIQLETWAESHQGRFPENLAELGTTIGKDEWGRELAYSTDGSQYWLVSTGKDGVAEVSSPAEYRGGGTTNFDCDIVYSNGGFLQHPQGAQQ